MPLPEHWTKKLNDYQWGEPVDSWNRFLEILWDNREFTTIGELNIVLKKLTGKSLIITIKDNHGNLCGVKIDEEFLHNSVAA